MSLKLSVSARSAYISSQGTKKYTHEFTSLCIRVIAQNTTRFRFQLHNQLEAGLRSGQTALVQFQFSFIRQQELSLALGNMRVMQ